MDASRSLLLKLLRLLSESINEEISMFSMLSDASPFTDLRKHSSAREQASSPKRRNRRVSRPVLKTTLLWKTPSMFWRPSTLLWRPYPVLKANCPKVKTRLPDFSEYLAPCSKDEPPCSEDLLLKTNCSILNSSSRCIKDQLVSKQLLWMTLLLWTKTLFWRTAALFERSTTLFSRTTARFWRTTAIHYCLFANLPQLWWNL